MRDNVSLWVMAGISEVAMAARFGISHDTLRRRFAEELRRGREQWQMHVLGLLMKAAESGNVTAMKTLLNRSDAVYSPPTAEEPAKPPKLGKKEQAQIEAQNPDVSTSMGELMARRQQAAVEKLH